MTLNSSEEITVYNKELKGPLAWRRESIKGQSWRVEFPVGAINELRELVALLRENPVPIEVLDATDYRLEQCTKLMKNVGKKLNNGPGLAIISKLPVNEFSKAEMKQIYWVLSGMLARPVA